jgi:SpoVK/Ycf46/Vps4 family AAA+-type ATPase
VTQVAQALVSLEAYDGVLVATSNLLPRVDPAFHRRFDLVLEVTTPGPDARRRMLDALARQLGVAAPDDAALARLAGLVPGHVAQAERRWRLVGAPATTAELVAQLRALVRGPITRSAVGFGAVTVAKG